MMNPLTIPPGVAKRAALTDLCYHVAGWDVHQKTEVDSTQVIAKGLPAWSAVVAEVQSQGRGQYERTFTSDRGGLFLTAVLPFDGDAARSRGFALAVGWAVCLALRAVGATKVRLRWPNDLMVGARKIGGILVEQASPSTVLVGVGLNVTNTPWVVEPALVGLAGRLQDCAEFARSGPAPLITPMLNAIRRAQREFARRGFAELTPAINGCWSGPRSVELELVGDEEPRVVAGVFIGIDAQGCLQLNQPSGAVIRVPEHHVRRLREV
jgi:BirA family biotin operon repressor/biotin-[acetyl-CoA-carboxylase] ligase